MEVVRGVFRRCAYVLIPMSIVLYKYYPHLGRAYHPIDGELTITGVTTNKNSLGLICFVLGLFILWEIILVWKTRQLRIDKTYLTVQIVIFLMIAWLIGTIDSFTSTVSLGFGSTVMLATAFGSNRSRVRHAWVFFGAALCLVVGVTLMSGSSWFVSVMEQIRGKGTFGGRIGLWADLIGLSGRSEWIGTGYDSYWLGERLEILWNKYWWRPTEAHNGYVETYLELGLIGVFLLAGVILSGWRKVRTRLISEPEIGPLLVGLFCAVLAYNTMESAIKLSNFLWAVFFLVSAGYGGLGWADTSKEKGAPE